jgi:hypothetical protein
MIISYQIENSQVVLLIFWTDYAKKKILYWLYFAWKEVLLPTLKGNNSCEMYNFRIKVGNVQMLHAEFDFYSASSLKQQSAGRHVAPLTVS